MNAEDRDALREQIARALWLDEEVTWDELNELAERHDDYREARDSVLSQADAVTPSVFDAVIPFVFDALASVERDRDRARDEATVAKLDLAAAEARADRAEGKAEDFESRYETAHANYMHALKVIDRYERKRGVDQ